MTVQFDPSRPAQPWTVRWREAGRHRRRRFTSEHSARAFAAAHMNRSPAAADVDTELSRERSGPRTPAAELTLVPGFVGPTPPDAAVVAQLRTELNELRDAVVRASGDASAVASAGGVYPYETSAGTRWRFAFRQSDGSLSNRRGFASPRAAAAAKRHLEESIRRGEVKVARDTFAMWWATFLADRRHYVSAGTLDDYANHGRKRLLPFFGELRLDAIDEPLLREWLGGLAARVEAGELSPKTVNNALTVLSVCLGEALHRGALAANPCARVRHLPVHDVEKDYLRLAEIARYLDGCAAHYRPLAEFLIATGARISEALDVRWRDVDWDVRAVRIYRQRDRAASGSARTKGRRFRSVAVGPGLIETLRGLPERSPAPLADDFVFLCPPARRGRYAGRDTLVPPHRKTVQNWHEAALTDAELRDMPLHALRHTAAAAWLITGRPLVFVQRQLGHRSITTTERHYGHLEQSFLHAATEETEDAIRRAGTIGEWAPGPRSAALAAVALQRASE